MYDPYADENVYDYDYSEPNDYDNTSIINETGLNPMYKVTPDTQDTGVNDFYAIQQRPENILRVGFDINTHNPESMDRLDSHRRTPQVCGVGSSAKAEFPTTIFNPGIIL